MHRVRCVCPASPSPLNQQAAFLSQLGIDSQEGSTGQKRELTLEAHGWWIYVCRFLVQIVSSYSTLPLYALVSQVPIDHNLEAP